MSEFASLLYPYWQAAVFGVFLAIAIWAFWPSSKRKEEMRDHAEIPFRDDDKEHA